MWCLWVGGMNPSGWVSATAPIAGEEVGGPEGPQHPTDRGAECLSDLSRSALYYVDLSGGKCGKCLASAWAFLTARLSQSM